MSFSDRYFCSAAMVEVDAKVRIEEAARVFLETFWGEHVVQAGGDWTKR